MNYQITESEYNQIAAVRGQIGLVSGLLTATGANANLYDAEDLQEFLAAQEDSLRGVLHATEERYQLQRDEGAALTWIDWMTVIRTLSGADNPPGYMLADISTKMERAAQVNPDMRNVLKAWSLGLVQVLERGASAGPASDSAATEAPATGEAHGEQMSTLRRYLKREKFSAQESIQIGVELKLLKEASGHGNFLARLGELGIEQSYAKRHMRVARVFSTPEAARIVTACASQSKLFELLSLGDDRIEELARAGETGALKLEAIPKMTARQLRAAVRQVVQVDAAVAESLAGKNAKVGGSNAVLTPHLDGPDSAGHPSAKKPSARKRDKLPMLTT